MECEVFRIFLKHVSDHLSVLFQFAWLNLQDWSNGSIAIWTELQKHFLKSERISFDFTEGLGYTFPDHKCQKCHSILRTCNRFLKWMQWKIFFRNIYIRETDTLANSKFKGKLRMNLRKIRAALGTLCVASWDTH